MLSRRVLSLILAFSLVAVLALVAVPIARADFLMNFDSVLSSCESGTYTVVVATPRATVEGVLAGLFNVRVEVWDSDGTKLGEDAFGANLARRTAARLCTASRQLGRSLFTCTILITKCP